MFLVKCATFVEKDSAYLYEKMIETLFKNKIIEVFDLQIARLIFSECDRNDFMFCMAPRSCASLIEMRCEWVGGWVRFTANSIGLTEARVSVRPVLWFEYAHKLSVIFSSFLFKKSVLLNLFMNIWIRRVWSALVKSLVFAWSWSRIQCADIQIPHIAIRRTSCIPSLRRMTSRSPRESRRSSHVDFVLRTVMGIARHWMRGEHD